MVYDVIVIGGGPAGITAAMYVKRANKSVAILEKFALGGQVNLIGKIENYLGFESIDGTELAVAFSNNVKNLNIPVFHEEVKNYDLSGELKKVITRKNIYEARAIIFAIGSHTIPLGVDGEQNYNGNGVSYCAVCDGNFFKGKKVAVIGSGNEALSDTEYLSNICSKVYLLLNKKQDISSFNNNSNIDVLHDAQPVKILGDDRVNGIKYLQDSEEKTLNIDGIFIAIGRKPDTENLVGKLELNNQGYIKSNNIMHTSVEGVFVCGDAREGNLKQISVATGEGAVAGTEAIKYISLLNFKNITK